MDAITRKLELSRIGDREENVVMTGIPLRYRGSTSPQKVYRIPLAYLVYNKYNGRIGTDVKSFEKENYVLDPEKDKDCKIIEEFLLQSKLDRNEKTMLSLLNDKQQRYGIVTADGIIVDGNRRALLLNKLFRERDKSGLEYAQVEHCQYFLAVILPEDATKRDIEQLETIYQMGEDDKLDYNPIEKYLKCSDLKQLGFSTSDIAQFMGEKEPQIEKWLSILGVMEDYLDTYGYEGIYTRLEKTEGPFVDLDTYLAAYKSKGKNTAIVDWIYQDTDISDLKLVCFDYIRARYEGKEFREIAKTGNGGCIFAYQELWDSFLKEHKAGTPPDKQTTEEARKANPTADLSKVLRARDVDWATAAKDVLAANLGKHTSKLDDRRDANQPLKLLEKALDALRAVDSDQPTFYTDPTVSERVKEINTIIWEMKKSLDRNA